MLQKLQLYTVVLEGIGELLIISLYETESEYRRKLKNIHSLISCCASVHWLWFSILCGPLYYNQIAFLFLCHLVCIFRDFSLSLSLFYFFFSIIVTVWFSAFCLLISYPETGISHCLWPVVLTSFHYSAISLRTSVSFPLILKSICCITVQNLISVVSHVCFIC